MFLGQAGMFLSFQAGRSSDTRSSTSDLTVARKRRVLMRFCMKTVEMCFSKTCINFGRCFDNQGLAEADEK